MAKFVDFSANAPIFDRHHGIVLAPEVAESLASLGTSEMGALRFHFRWFPSFDTWPISRRRGVPNTQKLPSSEVAISRNFRVATLELQIKPAPANTVDLWCWTVFFS